MDPVVHAESAGEAGAVERAASARKARARQRCPLHRLPPRSVRLNGARSPLPAGEETRTMLFAFTYPSAVAPRIEPVKPSPLR